MIATPPSATAVAVVAKPTTDKHQPGDDDVDPGTGVTATSPRPRPPRPGNASRFRSLRPQKPSKLAENTVHVADYLYRYYDPLTGRWPSRDPIGERGELNIYNFVGNGATSRIDIIGLIAFTDIGDGVGFVTKRGYAFVGTCCEGSCADIMSKFKANINYFTYHKNKVIDTPFTDRNGGVIETGDILDIDGPGPVNPSVGVVDSTPSSVTFQTIKGHPESAKIKFSCSESVSVKNPLKTDIRFSIESLGQASTLTDLAIYTTGDPVIDGLAQQPIDIPHKGKDLIDSTGNASVRGYGYMVQTKIWQNVLSKVSTRAACLENDEILFDYWWKNAKEVPNEARIK